MSDRELTEVDKRALLRELVERERRAAAAGAATQPTPAELEKANELEGLMFRQQREFYFNEKSKRRVARCTRRAGKTIGSAMKICITLLRKPRASCLYVAKVSGNAREYIWRELKQLVADHDLPFEFSETHLRLSHKRSTGLALFRGADTTDAVEKFRGFKWDLAILDESGTYGAQMEALVVSVIGPSLRDNDGELLLIGTPGYYPAGLFYEASSGIRANWARYSWSLQDNPYLSASAKDLDLICEEEGLSRDDPAFVREYEGKYCIDERTQMFLFDPAKNVFHDLAEMPKDLEWIIGIDFGWNDSTAIVPVGYSRTSKKMWVPECWSAPKQVSDKIAEQLLVFIEKYRPKRIVGDTGGYGKGPTQEIWHDYKIFIEGQNKKEKVNHIEFINSAFKRGDLVIHRDCNLVKTLPLVLWNENKTDAHDKAKDDEAMALLYAWRNANNLAGRIKTHTKADDLAKYVGQLDPERLAELSEERPDEVEWYLRSL